MAGCNGAVLSKSLENQLVLLSGYGIRFGDMYDRIGRERNIIFMIAVFGGMALLGKNSMEMAEAYQADIKHALLAVTLFIIAVLHLPKITEFLYINF